VRVENNRLSQWIFFYKTPAQGLGGDFLASLANASEGSWHNRKAAPYQP
jgi:hypothetical protein